MRLDTSRPGTEPRPDVLRGGEHRVDSEVGAFLQADWRFGRAMSVGELMPLVVGRTLGAMEGRL